MIVEECNKECIDDVGEILERSLSWFHAYYASVCIEQGICRALVCRDKDIIAGVGVFYAVETKPTSIGVIYYVAVEKNFRGHGIGKAIVASMEELMEIDGVEFYIASTRSDNIASRRMLEELNYSCILLEDLDNDFREIVEALACAYEDDVLYIKSVKGNVEQFKSVLLDEANRRKIRKLWSTLCHGPWLMLRRRV
ncbi:MAG: GNAT family N-acetyltransferase [Ignisphaera sp.]|nr:GNAT family N-acetyltransferase [Ignisphaera sp.]MCX8167732.1 GNAT family N-acetyltransferase [Ignisphaera sp.]MDW8085296.1 GNAT family N-acetyltransferase [Ignisphaera sp.]